jgi:outer membrane protein TolC
VEAQRELILALEASGTAEQADILSARLRLGLIRRELEAARERYFAAKDRLERLTAGAGSSEPPPG